MSKAIRWRPLGPADLDRARDLVGEAITSWRDDWFGTRGMAAMHLESVRLISKDTPYDFARARAVSHGGSAASSPWWSIDRNARRLLAALALDLTGPLPIPATSGAACPLTTLGERIIEELGNALCTLCDGTLAAWTPPAPARLHDAPVSGVLLRLVAACGDALCEIVCPAPLILDRPVTRREPTRANPLTSAYDALATTTVRISATLGHAQLSLHQLLDLAPGDVITVDRKLHDPIALVVSSLNTRERPPFAYGRLGRTSDKLSIQLATPTSL
ncbi:MULTISPECIES: FliM/FliN family flagellar motor switch protein [unclassified Caballeronia]|uniref:FliM/FliN family flagellar motor switch protein n=1 Tax=unclassified Caballeronia TaxID=2646786 RepID=UPI00285AE015|nr:MULTISPECIES: FliM/FliN family flagellar motor switch protein [unclassified Caballeronia]MDR5774150.1 FliM/FliN family flagellar motor switch protein [Caballeronia sp. LZ002]MDR5849585.1 FliM/FliN family flagellar motor switch protein [Caballeronia sp. LZ003]